MTAGFVAAASFLTRVPVRRNIDAPAVAAAAPYYPLVGGLIGAAAAAVGLLLARVMPPTLAAALVVGGVAAATGAMHLDALGDAADGLGGRTRDDRLRIMRDHSLGAYGACALVLLIVIEVTAIAALLSTGTDVVFGFIAAFAASRAVAAPIASVLPYAREDRSPASFMSRRHAVGTAAVAVAICAPAGATGAAVIAAAAIVTVVAACMCARWFGGVTGDLLGATISVTEAVALAVVVVSEVPA